MNKLTFCFFLFSFLSIPILCSKTLTKIQDHKIKNCYFNVSSQSFFVTKEIYSSYFSSSIFKESPKLDIVKNLDKEIKGHQVTKLEKITLLLTSDKFWGLINFSDLSQHLMTVWFGLEPQERNRVQTIILAYRKEQKWTGLREFRSMMKDIFPEEDFLKKYMKALFPYATIMVWDEFVNKYRKQDFVKFQSLFISDYERTVLYWKPVREQLNFKEIIKNTVIDKRILLRSFMHTYTESVLRNLHVVPKQDNSFNITFIYRDPTHSKIRCAPRLTEEVQQEFVEALSSIKSTNKGVHLEIVDFSKVTLEEQMRIISHTDLLIGTKGWEFAYSVFLPKNALTLEISSLQFFHLLQQSFAKLSDTRYAVYRKGDGVIEDETTIQKLPQEYVCHQVIEELDIPCIIDYITKKIEKKTLRD